MRRLAILVLIAALAALAPAALYSQRGDAPKQEQPKSPPRDNKSPEKGKSAEKGNKDAPDRRDRMKQRDKEMDRILNRKGKG